MSTAASVPSWQTAENAAPGSSQPSNAGTMRRCALDEIGRNSVSPCTIPRMIDWNRSTARRRVAAAILRADESTIAVGLPAAGGEDPRRLLLGRLLQLHEGAAGG